MIALRVPQSIFDLATQYAFAGYAALSPLLVAALFWKGSTKWGALASTLWTAAAVLGRRGACRPSFRRRRRARRCRFWSIGGVEVVTRAAAGTMVLGLLPVVPMTIISALLMVVVSLLDAAARGRARATLAKYFAGLTAY